MHQAYDFIHSETGEGIKASEPFESIKKRYGLALFMFVLNTVVSQSYLSLRAQQVMNICPYYYELEEKFTCRACIQPMSTSADLFARHRESVQVNTDDDNKCDNDLEDDGFSVINDSFSTSEGGANNQTTEPMPTKAKKRSEPASTKKKGKTKAAKKVSTEIDGFNAFMLTLAKDRLEERKNSCSKTATTVVLAEHFRRMSDALGSSVKAAYNCEDFV